MSPGISQGNQCQRSVSDYTSTNFHALKCFILGRKQAQSQLNFHIISAFSVGTLIAWRKDKLA